MTNKTQDQRVNMVTTYLALQIPLLMIKANSSKNQVKDIKEGFTEISENLLRLLDRFDEQDAKTKINQ